jgi:hypothetical protein
MTPLNFVKIVFRNFGLLNAPELVFKPIFTNKIKFGKAYSECACRELH